MKSLRRTITANAFRALVLAALTLAATGVSFADPADEQDHERARQALEAGKARPLTEILDAVRGELGGEVVGVEFDLEEGRYVYEFKVIETNGRLREVIVDALTATVIAEGED